MKKDYQIWNVLHDGALKNLDGSVPGDLCIQVNIEYLANRLRGGFNNIFVKLINCTLFEYERHWSEEDIRYYSSIEELTGISPGLMALSCEEKLTHLEIHDICGVIRTKYDLATLTLEDGSPLTFQEIDSVSKEYWNNFGRKQ